MNSTIDRANEFLKSGRYEEAERLFRRLIEEEPANGDVFFGLGSACRNRGGMQQAAQAYRRAAELQPLSFAAHFNAGLAYYSLNDFASAAAMLTRAVELKGDSSDALRFLGVCLIETGNVQKGQESIRRATEADAQNAAAWYNLGNILRDTGSAAEAQACFECALKLQPDYREARANLGELFQATGRIDEALQIYEQILTRAPRTPVVVSNTLLCYNYKSGLATADVYERHSALAGKCFDGPHEAPPVFTQRRAARGRIRIGYVSPDFRQHSVACFLHGPLAHHDRDEFEIFCYANVARSDEKTAWFKTQATWRDILRDADAVAAERIRTDSIDILIDLAGHTAGNRLGVFTRRPAPVQVTYLGYPNTTGLRAVDYRLTDFHADPEGFDRYYTEKLVRLPSGFLCFTPPPCAPAAHRSGGQEFAGITFGSFNNPAKISDETVDVWAKILSGLDGAGLILKNRFLDEPEAGGRLRRRFSRRGIDPRRIALLGRSPSLEDHLAQYGCIDIALDTFPYNGTTTTCEALWMGVPVVTIAGDRHSSRVGTSLLRAVGLAQYIAASIDEYVSIATSLAADRMIINEMRGTLRDTIASSPLCDGAAFTRGLEEAYRQIWQKRRIYQ